MNNTDLFLWVSNLYFYWKLDISKLCYMVIFKCRSISPSVFTRISCSHVFVLFYFLFCWCWCCYCWFWLLISKIICVCMGGGVACTHMQMCLSVCTWRFIAWSIIFHLWLYTHCLNAGSLNWKLPILVRLVRQWAFRVCLSQSLNAMVMGIYAAMCKHFLNACLGFEGRSFCLSSNHAYHLNPQARSWSPE